MLHGTMYVGGRQFAAGGGRDKEGDYLEEDQFGGIDEGDKGSRR